MNSDSPSPHSLARTNGVREFKTPYLKSIITHQPASLASQPVLQSEQELKTRSVLELVTRAEPAPVAVAPRTY